MVYDARKALLPTYSVLDGAKALLESHRIGKGIVGGVGARAFLPGMISTILLLLVGYI